MNSLRECQSHLEALLAASHQRQADRAVRFPQFRTAPHAAGLPVPPASDSLSTPLGDFPHRSPSTTASPILTFPSRGTKPMSAQPTERREFQAWGKLSAPIFPEDTHTIMRAQSILTGGELEGVGPLLPIEQARDVVAWFKGV